MDRNNQPLSQTELPEEDRMDKKAIEAERDEETRAAVLRTVIILAMVIVLVFGMILTIRFIPRTVNLFSSFGTSISNFFKGSEHLTIKADDTNVQTGTPVTFTLEHVKKDTTKTGTYAFSYPCVNGFHFEQTTATNSSTFIHCDTLTSLTDLSPLILTPISVNSSVIDVPVTLSYTEQGSTTPSLTATTKITVVNSTPVTQATTTQPIPKPVATTTKPTTQKPVTTTPKPVVVKSPYPDLTVRIIATGIIDPITGRFVETSNIGPYDRAAVKFDVKNIGGEPSGTWSFTANLPSNTNPFYQSGLQNSISPESGVVFTLGFTPNQNQYMQNGQITITVDPNNTIREMTKTNNTITTYLNR